MGAEWSFEGAPNSAAISERSIVDGAAPILYVSHDVDDGSWQFLAGVQAPDLANVLVVGLRTILALDATVRDTTDLPPGGVAWRSDSVSPWVRLEPPYFLIEGDDFDLFPSVDHLTSNVEAQDVRDGVFRTFDALGTTIVLQASSDRAPVTASLGLPDAPELQRLIVEHIQYVGPARFRITANDLTSLPLAGLVALMRSRYGRF